MGPYIRAYLGTTLGPERSRILHKIRNLLTCIRTLSHLVRSSIHMRSQASYLGSKVSPCVSVWKPSFKILRRKPLISMTSGIKHEAVLCCAQASRIYSTSSREAFKAEAPIGVYQNNKAAFHMQLLQMRLGDSYRRLSKHINVYFKQKENAASCGSGQASNVQEPITRVQRRAHNHRALSDRTFVVREHRESLETFMDQREEPPSLSAHPGLQLFHTSSLATRFGESYSYVASHINSVFSKNPVKQAYEKLPASEDMLKRYITRKRAVTHHQSTTEQNVLSENSSTLFNTSPAGAGAGAGAADVNNTDLSCSWEEGYLHFAHRINQYFRAKMAYASEESQRNQSTHLTSRQQTSAGSQGRPTRENTQNSIPLRPKSLFHISNLTTRFGENYAYMATHINCYFKGSAASEEEVERDPYQGQAEDRAAPERKTVSIFQHLQNPSALTSIVGHYLGTTSSSPMTANAATEAILDRVSAGRRLAEETTRVLLGRLKKAKSRSSISSCVEALNAHLIMHPACKAVVWQEKAVLQVLKYRQHFWLDKKLQGAIRETLALIGYVDPLKGRGIRVLSIDGGGTRGVVPLQMLKQLEAQTGQCVYQLFDYICGVSTGAILAFTLALARISVEECEEMYQRFGSDVFSQNPIVGTVKMGWTHSYYNTETWETILKEKIGDELLIRTARNELSPKVSAISAVVNWGISPKPFIFRNYNHPPGRLSRYAGGSGYELWQAVRTSSAAPGYFQEFPLHNDIHQDGGLILNNPCALAIHESRLLWPNQPFQCVLSLGTGRYDNATRGPATSTSLRAKISNLIRSATDTEGVHTLLEDLLEPNVYFRFNPMMSSEVSLDESRPSTLQQLKKDTQHYLGRNQSELELLCKVLGEERTALGKTWNWISEKGWELQQRLV